MNKITERIGRLIASARRGHRYKLERAILEFTEQIVARMAAKEITPTTLAERMQVEPPYVSKILRGTSNFTLDSMIKICSAVDAEFCFHVRPREVTATWEEYPLLKFHYKIPAKRAQPLTPVPRYNVSTPLLRISTAPHAQPDTFSAGSSNKKDAESPLLSA